MTILCFLLQLISLRLTGLMSQIFMQPTVDIKTVLSLLMDRLSNYAVSSTEVSFQLTTTITNIWCYFFSLCKL